LKGCGEKKKGKSFSPRGALRFENTKGGLKKYLLHRDKGQMLAMVRTKVCRSLKRVEEGERTPMDGKGTGHRLGGEGSIN